MKEQPDCVLVYGYTNSTLAEAQAAVKLHIKLARVEAGLCSFNSCMPGEINRVVTDHIADLQLCPTQTAVDNLAVEGITVGVHLVGDVVCDGLMWAVERGKNTLTILEDLGLTPKNYAPVTVPWAENTNDPER